MNFLLGLQHLDTLQDVEVVAFDCETTQLQPAEGKMRQLQKDGWSYRQLAFEFDVDEKHAWRICNNQAWTWLK